MDRLSLLVRAKISIHASAKEATSLHMLIHLSYLDFNPRLREGGDGIQRHNRLEESKISIHASAKEATSKMNTQHIVLIFQSTPPRRRRLVPNHVCPKFPLGFQSTPPRRRRPCGWWLICWVTIYFNPRLREGGDVSIGANIVNGV